MRIAFASCYSSILCHIVFHGNYTPIFETRYLWHNTAMEVTQDASDQYIVSLSVIQAVFERHSLATIWCVVTNWLQPLYCAQTTIHDEEEPAQPVVYSQNGGARAHESQSLLPVDYDATLQERIGLLAHDEPSSCKAHKLSCTSTISSKNQNSCKRIDYQMPIESLFNPLPVESSVSTQDQDNVNTDYSADLASTLSMSRATSTNKSDKSQHPDTLELMYYLTEYACRVW